MLLKCRLIVALILLSLVAACGGGGDSSGTDTSAGNVPIGNTDNESSEPEDKQEIDIALRLTFETVDSIEQIHTIDRHFTNLASGGKSSGAITYSSENTAVATVDANSGKVSIIAVGVTKITATKAADDNYASVSASYQLVVFPSPDIIDAAISFPPKSSLTDAKSIVVRGESFAKAGVKSVVVNGVVATSEDNFSHWQATVKLVDGTNIITATVIDNEAIEIYKKASLGKQPLLLNYDKIAINPSNGELYSLNYIDEINETTGYRERNTAVFSIDPNTGKTATIITPNGESIAPISGYTRAFEFDSTQNRLLVSHKPNVDADYGPRVANIESQGPVSTMTSISLDDGTHTIAYQDEYSFNYSNYVLAAPNGITPYPGDSNRVLIVDEDRNRESLLALDLTTGKMTVISSRNVGKSIEGRFVGPRHVIAFPGDDSRVLVTDSCTCGGDGLVSIDLATGDRTEYGYSESNTDVRGMEKHPSDDNIMLVAHKNYMIGVDLTTGQVTTISNSSIGEGDKFSSLSNIKAHPGKSDTVLVTDGAEIFEVDLLSGNRTILSDASNGAGINFVGADGLIVDPNDNNVLYVSDNNLGAIIKVNISTGDRTVFSGFNPDQKEIVGSGNPFIKPRAISLNPKNTTSLLVADSDKGTIYSVDLQTGNREVFGTKLDENNTLGGVESFAWDAINNRVFLYDSALKALIEHRFDNGERRVIASGISYVTSLVWHNNSDSLYVLNQDPAYIMQIDMHDLSQTFISGFSQGVGPELGRPAAMSLDFDNNYLLVADNEIGISLDNPALRAAAQKVRGIVRIDLRSKERTLVSEPTAKYPYFADIKLDASNKQLFAVGYGIPELINIDLVSGKSRTTTINSVGEGDINFQLPINATYADKTKQLFVLDQEHESLISIDLKTGLKQVVASFKDISESDNFHPDDVMNSPTNEDELILAYNKQLVFFNVETGKSRKLAVNLRDSIKEIIAAPGKNDKILVWTSSYYSKIYEVDLITGESTELSVSTDRNIYKLSLSLHPKNTEQVLFANERAETLTSIDLATGSTQLISGEGTGDGIELDYPQGILPYPGDPEKLLLLNDRGRSIISVDLETGDRTLISGETYISTGTQLVGQGPDFYGALRLIASPTQGSIWVVDPNSGIYTVDLSTGDRVLSSR